MELSNDQIKAFNLFKNGQNIFISGPGGTGNTPAWSPTIPQGNSGGGCGPGSGYNNAGGGGGAGYNGQTGGSPGSATSPGGHGGVGVEVKIAGPTNDAVGGTGPGPTAGGWFAGGGGGSTHDGPPTTFGYGGSWSNPNTLIANGPFSGGGQGWPGDTNQTSKPQTEAMNGLATSGGGGGSAQRRLQG